MFWLPKIRDNNVDRDKYNEKEKNNEKEKKIEKERNIEKTSNWWSFAWASEIRRTHWKWAVKCSRNKRKNSINWSKSNTYYIIIFRVLQFILYVCYAADYNDDIYLILSFFCRSHSFLRRFYFVSFFFFLHSVQCVVFSFSDIPFFIWRCFNGNMRAYFVYMFTYWVFYPLS